MELMQDHSLLYSNDDYEVKLETVLDKQYLHVDVYKWNKDIYKHMLETWILLSEYMFEEEVDIVYVCCNKDNLKLKKFLTMFNFCKILTNEHQEIWGSLTAPRSSLHG